MAVIAIIEQSSAVPDRLIDENFNGLVSEWAGTMTTAARKHTPGQIDRAGKILSSESATKDQIDEAIAAMDDWRLSHTAPLDSARKTLEERAKQVSPTPTIGARLKREESIRAKLVREPAMKLSTMQDIGGCRVILPTMKEVDELVALYAADPDTKVTDYVANPRVSGYRGKHIIWRFKSEDQEFACYNNMRIELQIRTELQHSWATAVEVCSTFTDQNLKSDHPQVKDERWVRFFALTGSLMALTEGGGLVKDTPTRRQKLISELSNLVN